MHNIRVKNLSKAFRIYHDRGVTLKEKILFRSMAKYTTLKVLDNVDLDIETGKTVALIGKNGSGKSTLLKLMSKIIYPDSGVIEIDGKISSLLELGAGFHPDFSGRENIYFNASIFGLSKKEIESKFDEIIEFSELGEFIDNPVRTYSSGMYMRLAFSVAINVGADVLLIDEILAVGDANFQKKCFNKIRDLKAEKRTIKLVTHDLAAAKEFCDEAVWLDEGKIAGRGTPEAVIGEYLRYMEEK